MLFEFHSFQRKSGTAMDGLTHGVNLLKNENSKKCATFFNSYSKNQKTNAYTKCGQIKIEFNKWTIS